MGIARLGLLADHADVIPDPHSPGQRPPTALVHFPPAAAPSAAAGRRGRRSGEATSFFSMFGVQLFGSGTGPETAGELENA
eukprot:CAMPEP_0204577044 /NCGR_PEP_ID=MMETSP0661-20131031/42124_1 /ASSEMBLY_ACC=CAM_ASM_000606 /TAXON_ID=109239 /ORGANISM="Alexandrium margalefi, Strain AMGDE01CS-322" /LENGTH=80 /DNA_ID=CAMNT_0051585847 /DNA_START=43 /DNA_END=282 /DNA_ORIENTATION=+